MTVGGGITSANGVVTLKATGDLTVNSSVTINSGTGTMLLGADLTSAGAGDDGTGILTVANSASVTSANTTAAGITLQGADISLAGTVSATGIGGGVTVRSSVLTRPMSIGGTDSAVTGINLTDAELLKISTAATGAVTFGDGAQVGDITITTASPATTAGTAIIFQQLTTGAGKIVLDDGANTGTALSGNGGTIALIAGTGGIVALAANNTSAEIATTGASVTLNTSGAIGTASNRIQFADNTTTTQQNVIIGSSTQTSNVFLDGLGSLTLGSITGSTANTNVDVTARTNLVVATSAIITTGTGTISLGADLTAASAADNKTGSLTISSSANVTSASTAATAITIRGADMTLTGTVAATGTTGGIVIAPSDPTLPMSLGGLDNAVTGVNLTDSELLLVTTATGG
ncbi:MAG: hypothetical protein JWM11_512, partial [Planctomycetaceae bacterium]|nr:hypothetical protein [Planctomycetaceae bacterium]